MMAIRPGKIDLEQLKAVIDQCRIVKFPHEIELIKRANDISAKAHRAVLEYVRHFRNERQVEGLFLDTCVSAGAHNQAYSIIAGAGTNAAVLHYIANDAPFGDSQVILLDAGAEYECYASDVTRTFPISGHWSTEAKNIYDAVQDMQEQCISRIKPGVHFRDLQILSMAIAVRWLLKLGILHNGSLEKILRAGTIRAFFPHGLGHHIGLEVHDVLGIAIQSKAPTKAVDIDMLAFEHTELEEYSKDMILELYTTLIDAEVCMAPTLVDSPVLEPGMVVTVEPGLYFSDFALSKVYLRDPQHAKYINREVLSKYMSVGGVRIEDDILVTTKGYTNLTTAPKGEEALRIIRGEPNKGKQRMAMNQLVQDKSYRFANSPTLAPPLMLHERRLIDDPFVVKLAALMVFSLMQRRSGEPQKSHLIKDLCNESWLPRQNLLNCPKNCRLITRRYGKSQRKDVIARHIVAAQLVTWQH